MRTFVIAAQLIALLNATVALAAYPERPIRMLVASSAGSNPDPIGRIFATGLGQVVGQQVIVDNRAGAGGNIGAEIAARAAPDGYTIFLAHTNHSINTALYRKLSYDILRDFAPVTLVATSAFVAVVHPSIAATSFRISSISPRAAPAGSTMLRRAREAGLTSQPSISPAWRT